MPDSNGAAVGINMLGIVGETKRACYRQDLRGKSFVQFKYIYLVQR